MTAWLRLDRGRPTQALGVLQVSALLQLGQSDAFAQCALCRDAIAASPPQTREAMNYAIIGLAFAPYGVAAVAVWALSPSVRASVRAMFARIAWRKAGVRS